MVQSVQILSLALLLISFPAAKPFSTPCTFSRGGRALSGGTDRGTEVLISRSSLQPLAAGAAALSMAAGGRKRSKSKLGKALNKVSQTISVDVQAADALLSKRLRQIGIATIFVNAELLPILAEEQQQARGDFPGPVPVILRQPDVTDKSLAAAKASGASGVVLSMHSIGCEGCAKLAAAAAELDLESMWEVCTKEEAAEAMGAGAAALLVSNVEDSFGVAPAFWEGLPKNSVAVAEVKAKQPGNSEIGLARALGAAGCKAVLLSGACPEGEVDAHRYVDSAFRTIRSKKSEEFQIGGMVGSASPIGAGSMSHATKEPTIIKETIEGY
mmetsp:Transcript_61972/g.128202  ORF Transcript_61972/g.128202 Transcript_61972/m.128202 type:complete len:328 (-) Transcript_61972:377-1360(-)|eukprot:CAMPEP_0181291372 /NCGR_PEP_ID=MMETSP1101-20121128/1931_1 /TAXON_ID=46948 /ORGANISM="Rhodomonas abbreviata, Strain Caron Lab Isolate" /LENGTH=327 /DNA_ID=CAMNT_0023395757 /DNA_START=616 /DNA_END=1599 /DNA_ORIENTATION=-